MMARSVRHSVLIRATAVALLLWLCPRAHGTESPASDAAWNSARPRLFFTAEKMARLRQRIEQDERIRAAWQRIRERADRQLKEGLVAKDYAESGTGQHGNYGAPSGQIASMAPTLGLAYCVTGNQEYARKLKEALLHYGQLARWAGDAGNVPPWHSELNTARFCFGYAVGYDCIHDYLSEPERVSIAQAMIRLGILPTLNDWLLPGQRIHALDSMGHNWWSVCVSMAGLAALSLLGDEPRAEAWVQEVSEAFPEWFDFQGNILQNKSRNFDRHGAFYESVNYAEYALSEYLLFRLAYTNVFRDRQPPEIPLLKTVGDFFVSTCYPTADALLSVNFGDSSLRANGAKTLRLLLANSYDTPAYDWYLGRTNPGLDDPIGLVWYEARPAAQPPADLPRSVLYPDIGWAVLRSSWQDNATMLAVKSGFAWNHAHPDAGSFILFHEGRPVIIDSGNCSYSRREYTSYYRQSKAHNVVLIDGVAENPEDCGGADRGVVTPGRLPDLLDLAGVRYVFADATGPTAWKFSRNYRHFLWIDDVLLIFDDIRTHEAGQLEWLLHYEGSARRVGLAPPESVSPEGKSLGQAGTPNAKSRVGDSDPPYDLILTNEDAKVTVRPLFPPDMQVVEKQGLQDHQPDRKVTYLALTPPGTLREAKFVVAVVPMPNGQHAAMPGIEPMTAANALGVRLRDGRTVTDVWLNLMADGRRMHRNSNNIIDGWDTDAYLFALTRPVDADGSDPDSLTRCFVACGSYLRKDGKVMLHSLSKVNAVFTCGGPEMKIALHGQPITRASLRATAKPYAVSLNGRPLDPVYDAGNNMIAVRVATHEGLSQ
jgi:hypothetical protein